MVEERPGAHNEFGGAADTVFQARDVHGGVHQHLHQHQPERLVSAPKQVLPPPDHYTNNEAQLAALTAILTHRHDEDGPKPAIIRGAPGGGRTTLATTWLHRHREHYPDGQFLVRLGTGVADGERERAALADLLLAVGFGTDQIPASLDGRVGLWRSWSAGRRIAVIIDDALTPAQVISLLPGVGRSVVLVTESGQLNGLRARASARYVTLDPLSDESAHLLLGRMVGEDRIAAEPEAVTGLIGLCAGSATALCVVGAMLAEFDDRPIARLAATLANEERVLAELSQDPNLSLTVVFDAAYRRLDPLAQACYRLLGVHPGAGDVALETIAAVLGEPVADVAHGVRNLLRAMLVVETAEDRVLLAGLPRHHARATPSAAETMALRRGIVAHYRDRALAASMAWLPGRGWLQQLWPELVAATDDSMTEPRRWLAAERVNLRAAAEAAYAARELAEVCQFGVSLWPLHDQGKYASDLVSVSGLGVRAAHVLGNDLAAAVLGCQQGFGHRQRTELDRAVEVFEAARASAIRAGSRPAEATAVESLGLARLDQGRPSAAADLLRRNVELATVSGEPRRMALARLHLSKVESPATALALLDAARADFAALHPAEPYNLMKVDLWRGRKLTEDGRVAEAADALADASAAAEAGGWHFERAQVCEALADLALRLDDRTVARSHLLDALNICRHRGFTPQGVAVEARLAELA